MSRSSRKSELSPSATGSNIDLGKNDGVDMGRKAQPSVTSGELGVSTEITNIGGVSVTGGVSVDISPIDLGINYDPSENSVSVASGAEIPGGLLGVSGGLTVDLDTGEIIGGSVGGEVAGLGVNVSASKDGGLGVELTVQIPFTPIEFSVGFGFPPKKKEPIPTPAPEPPSSPGDGSDGGRFSAEDLEKIDPRDTIYVVGICKGVILLSDLARKILIQGTWYLDFNTNKATGRPTLGKIRAGLWWNGWRWNISRASYDWEDNPPPRLYYAKYNNQHSYQLIGLSHLPEVGEWVETNTHVHANFSYAVMSGEDFKASLTAEVQPSTLCPGGFPRWVRIEKYSPKGSTEDNPPRPFNEIYRPPTNTPDSPPPPFPNPPLRKQNKMDTCCQENLKFLRAIYTGLGISKFPGKLPATIIQEVSQEGEEPPEPPQVPIKDFVDLLTWQFERDDERWGQWEIQIDIKDSDITKEGDQKKSVKFPNLAESVAELEGQILSIMTNVEALVALQVKNLAESGMARQEAIKGYLASKAIIKYMAFKSSETDVPVPMTFTAGAETISELLKESEGHIKGTDYTEKETLRDVYLDLLQAAAIIRAVHWQKIDTKSDTKSQLLNILRGSVDLAASIAKPQNSNGDGGEKTFDPEKNFEDFIDSVEDGFRNTTGITDVQNPYGKSPDRRPRIRQIGDNISQAGRKN